MKRMNAKKLWRGFAVAAALLVAMNAVSCGAKSASDSYSGGSYYEASEEFTGAYEEDAYNGAYDDAYENSYSLEERATAVKGNGTSSAASDEQIEDKIIRTANIDMQSDDAQKCYDTLIAFVKENGGSELSVRKERNTYEHYEYLYIQATLKIPPDKLDAFMALAEKTDKVTNSSVSSDDVTREYYDIKLRLEAKKEALKNYYDLLKKAGSIQDSLEIQRYITDLTAEIESMEGMLKYYDARVDLSTVYLNISQQDRNGEIVDDFRWDSLSFHSFVTLLKNGFLGVLNFLWSLLLWIIIAVVALSPVLLIAGAVFFLVRRYRRKHPKASKASAQTGYTAPAYTVPAQNPTDPAQKK